MTKYTMPPAIVAKIAGFEIAIKQIGHNQFTVTYGQQTRTGLDYYDAAREIGSCVMHALTCDGSIENAE
jgi:hypothetical protein